MSLIATSNRVAMSRLVMNESAPFKNAERRVVIIGQVSQD